MSYGEIIKLIKDKVATYEGNLYFGSGTLKELNSKDNKSYPLIWLVNPVIKSNTIFQETILSPSYQLELRFLQSVDTTTPREQVDQIYDELDQLMNSFIISMLLDIQNKNLQPWTFGNASQIFKQMDDIHIGWSMRVNAQVLVPLNCCNVFN